MAVELIELVPAGVLAEDEPPRVLRRVRGAPDRIGKKSQLRAGAVWEPDLVHLHGLGEARADEHFAPGGVPAQKGRPTKLRITAHCPGERGWHSGDAFDDEVVAGEDSCFLGTD